MASRGPLAGRTLGELVLIERIGHGASGSVYRARQPVLERDAVAKVLRRPLRSSPSSIRR